MMRPLIYAMNLTLDGCCDHTKGIADEEMHDYYTELLGKSDTFLYGRTTYELMVPFWPDMAKQPGEDKSMNDYARAFVSVREIVVVSRTLNAFDDSKVRVIDNNLREEVIKLKSENGKAILTGGVNLPSQLIALDLVDEYIFVIQPLMVGEGDRLPPAATDTQKLELIETLTFKSGTVVLRYRRVR